ncbi:hypothetical protein DFH27DRAFT_217111 [Peziza echinospora]|nr:hypothetical protein DFH27DRAFT_217111 [Peziza echinospora]
MSTKSSSIAFLVFPRDGGPHASPQEQLGQDYLLFQLLQDNPTKPVVSMIQWPYWPRGAELDNYTTLIMKTCWDYHLRASEFREWLLDFKAYPGPKARIIGDVDVILWNLEKEKYLPEIATAGFKIPETLVLGPENLVEKLTDSLVGAIAEGSTPWGRYGAAVVKPAISAGSYNTIKFKRGDTLREDQKDVILQLQKDGGSVLVQEFMREIEEGEWSLIYIVGQYTHSILKIPAAAEKDAGNTDLSGDGHEFRCQARFGGVYVDSIDPPVPAREVSDRIVSWLKDKFGVERLSYVRVDGVMRSGNVSIPAEGEVALGEFVVMEVECIEPALSWPTRGGDNGLKLFAQEVL